MNFVKVLLGFNLGLCDGFSEALRPKLDIFFRNLNNSTSTEKGTGGGTKEKPLLRAASCSVVNDLLDRLNTNCSFY